MWHHRPSQASPPIADSMMTNLHTPGAVPTWVGNSGSFPGAPPICRLVLPAPSWTDTFVLPTLPTSRSADRAAVSRTEAEWLSLRSGGLAHQPRAQPLSGAWRRMAPFSSVPPCPGPSHPSVQGVSLWETSFVWSDFLVKLASA